MFSAIISTTYKQSEPLMSSLPGETFDADHESSIRFLLSLAPHVYKLIFGFLDFFENIEKIRQVF
jgi:hypothetical protein